VGDDLGNVTRRTLTDFYAIRSETGAPSTVSIDFRLHRVFLRWLVSEEEIASSPMDRMRQPRQPMLTPNAQEGFIQAGQSRTWVFHDQGGISRRCR
jgi:site-specific recombinase XerC